MADKKTISIGPGIAVYPRLKTPDTKFHDLGIYKSDTAVPLEEAEADMEFLASAWKAHTGKALKKNDNPLWDMETDEEGEETGKVVFKIRVKNVMTQKGEKWDRRPVLFDADLKPIPDANPYGGSTIIVNAEVHEWEYGGKKGISLRPLGVQVLDLKTGTGASAAEMGFTKREGYVSDQEASSGLSDQSNTPEEGVDGEDAGDY